MTLYDSITRAPVEIAALLRDEILVVHYNRPTIVGHIHLLPTEDTTNTLWEVLLSNPTAEEALGTPLNVGDILTTLRRWPRDTGLETQAGQRVFVMSIEAAGVRGVIKVDAATVETV